MAKLILTTLALWNFSAYGQNLFVQSVKAELRATPSNSSPSQATLSRGTEVQVLKTQGPWTEVKAGGKTGWCLKLFLSPHKPIGAAALEKELAPSVEKSTRRRSSSYSSAASARGLMSDERTRTGREKYRSDYEAVDKINQEKVSDEAVEKFNNEAKAKAGK